ncbi:MAG: DsbC family protein [Pseudomonadota bacterium]
MKRNWIRELKIASVLSGLGLIVCTSIAFAQDNFAEGSEVLRAQLTKSLQNLPITGIYDTELDGFFYVEMENGQSLYGSADGKYIFSGDLYRLGAQVENLAETRRSVKRVELMNAVPREHMVVFSPSTPAKTHISVFTDVDCGYCRKLHLEMDEINALGIEVRYLAYPRQGLGTPTYTKIVSAWCAANPNDALTALKTGKSIPTKHCDNPVADQYDLGQQVGVTGTPAIVTADGRLLPGYMPADRLAEAIGLDGR